MGRIPIYAVVYDFAKEGEAGLFAKLKVSGFKVTGDFRTRVIKDNSIRGNREIGQIDLYNGHCHLYVFEVEENPLKEFIEQYGSIENGHKKTQPRMRLR